MPKEGVYNAVITFDGDSISVRIPPSKKPFFSGKIVHMPTPHGRLIDADALLRVIEENSYRLRGVTNSTENGMFLTGIRQAIDESPTIIEAEANE